MVATTSARPIIQGRGTTAVDRKRSVVILKGLIMPGECLHPAIKMNYLFILAILPFLLFSHDGEVIICFDNVHVIITVI